EMIIMSELFPRAKNGVDAKQYCFPVLVKDLSHVLDFLCHVKYVQIVGSPDNFGTSTIKTQFLSFDVSFFKSVEELE
ncbi:unnamed protein product, partial [Rotaria sp. Silwood1]